MDKIMEPLQRLGKALMGAVAVMPLAALMMGIGYWITSVGGEGAVIYGDLLLKTGKVVRTSDTLYYYRRRSDSITGTFSPKRGQVLDILEGLEKRVSLEAPRYLPAVRSRLLSASFNMLRLMPPCDPRYLDLSYRSWNNIVRLRDSCLRDVHVRARNKAAILISYMGQAALIRAINGK